MRCSALGWTATDIAIFVASPASAERCTAYEGEVFALADEAREFQRSETFAFYGFGLGGPYNGWLKRMQDVGQRPEARDFMGKHGFPPMDIHSVAWEYHTEGQLDAFWQEVEDKIVNAARC